MLPGFRLIAVTFLCGFVVVFAGLRMAASLNDIHEGLPVMAAHAAPVSIAPAADRDLRRGQSAVPVMYDLRFAVAPVSHVLVSAPPVLEPPAPPLAIAPPHDAARDVPAAAAESAKPEGAVAAIPFETSLTVAPAVRPGLDVAAEPLKPEAPGTAAERPAHPQQ